MQKSFLFALAGLLIATNASAVERFTAQNKKDYDNLLKKTTFYKDTQVRKIKYLAALMIRQLTYKIQPNNPLNLLQTQTTGAQNLEDFADYIMKKIGKPSKDIISAYTYAIDPFDQVASIENVSIIGKRTLIKMYFANFNKDYTPLIDTITKTYGKQTRLPRELSLKTLEEWRYQGGKTEPGI